MNLPIKALAAAAAGVVLAGGALAQGAAPFLVPIESEPAPKLIVEAPLPGPLARGLVFIPYRVENVRILAVAGESARNLSPRAGHLHITVDDLPWQWVEFSDGNTPPLVDTWYRLLPSSNRFAATVSGVMDPRSERRSDHCVNRRSREHGRRPARFSELKRGSS